MNKFSLKSFLHSSLAGHESSFKQTSYDDAKRQYLCQDQRTTDVYDFDGYVQENFPHHSLPASPDAIHIGKKNLYCVEFKNQHAGSVDSKNIQSKFRSGTEILRSMLAGFSARDCQYHFYVAYKASNRPKYFDYRPIERSTVRFSLEAINKELGGFYHRMLTEDVDFFKSEFPQLDCS